MTKILRKTCSSLVKIISDRENDCTQNKCKSANMGSSTVQLHGVGSEQKRMLKQINNLHVSVHICKQFAASDQHCQINKHTCMHHQHHQHDTRASVCRVAPVRHTCITLAQRQPLHVTKSNETITGAYKTCSSSETLVHARMQALVNQFKNVQCLMILHLFLLTQLVMSSRQDAYVPFHSQYFFLVSHQFASLVYACTPILMTPSVTITRHSRYDWSTLP